MTNKIIDDTYTINLDSDKWGWANLALDTTTVGISGSGGYAASTMAGYNGTFSIGTNTTPYVMNQSGRIDITGKDADINMNGKSLKTWMESVDKRLAILEPNHKLEAEWAELKELGDRYRQLEKDIEDKMKTWDILSKPE